MLSDLLQTNKLLVVLKLASVSSLVNGARDEDQFILINLGLGELLSK